MRRSHTDAIYPGISGIALKIRDRMGLATIEALETWDLKEGREQIIQRLRSAGRSPALFPPQNETDARLGFSGRPMNRGGPHPGGYPYRLSPEPRPGDSRGAPDIPRQRAVSRPYPRRAVRMPAQHYPRCSFSGQVLSPALRTGGGAQHHQEALL